MPARTKQLKYQRALLKKIKYNMMCASLSLLRFALQVVNILFWLLQNSYVLANECSWFNNFVNACTLVQWSCLNFVSRFAMTSLLLNSLPYTQTHTYKGISPEIMIMCRDLTMI